MRQQLQVTINIPDAATGGGIVSQGPFIHILLFSLWGNLELVCFGGKGGGEGEGVLYDLWYR